MRIRQIGDPILREVSVAVTLDQLKTANVIELVARMKSILNGIQSISPENGNALSAPQVGSLLRLIVLRIDRQFHVMVNPEFKPLSDRMFEFDEECFSLYDQRATVERFYSIEVKYLTENGETISKNLEGDNAGLVQHEVDHLDGVLFLDRLQQLGREATPIDEVLSEQPERLAQVKKMMQYMTG